MQNSKLTNSKHIFFYTFLSFLKINQSNCSLEYLNKHTLQAHLLLTEKQTPEDTLRAAKLKKEHFSSFAIH
jgi:hypothetical protein